MSDNYLNVPNALTVLRILMIPVTAVLIFRDSMIWALAVFLLACGTDLLDGYLARKYHLTTKLGIWLDPLADKLMAITVLVCFTVRGILPLFVPVVIIVKELLLLAGGAVVLRRGAVTPSNKFGKIAALLLNTSIATGFFYQYWAPYYLWGVYVALAVSVFAFVQYAVVNGHLLKKPKDS